MSTFCVLRIHANSDPDLDPDPGQTLMSQKVEFLHEKYSIVEERMCEAEVKKSASLIVIPI
jgi:hypothetical protein